MTKAPNHRQVAQELSETLDDFTATKSLFPELDPPIITPRWPNPHTRGDETLRAMIVQPLNQKDYREGWRLAAYVQGLEYLGWRFKVRHIARLECRRAIAEYRLDRSHAGVMAALNARGFK